MKHLSHSPIPNIYWYFVGFFLTPLFYNLRLKNATNSCTFLYYKDFQRYVPFLNRRTKFQPHEIQGIMKFRFNVPAAILLLVHLFFACYSLLIKKTKNIPNKLKYKIKK